MNSYDGVFGLVNSAGGTSVSSLAIGTVNTGNQGDLLMVFIVTDGATVTGITQGAGALDAWSFIGRKTGTTINVETWMTRAAGGTAALGTVSFSASATGKAATCRWTFPVPLTSLPSVSVASSGLAGNTTAPGGVAVAVGTGGAASGDLMVEHVAWHSVTAPTGETDSPSGTTQPSARWSNLLTGDWWSTVRHEAHIKAVRPEDPAGNYSRTAALAAATQWAAMAFALAGPPPGDALTSTSAVMAYKGRDTATDDQASVA